MDLLTLGLLVGGLVLLVAGGELLVRGSSKLAVAAGVPPVVVGLTIVAFGTSTPEAVVSAQTSLSGQVDISVGNVIGSNIFNALFILGGSALIVPLIVDQRFVWIDVPILIGVSVLGFALAIDGEISRLDGLFLVAGIIAYTIFAIRVSGNESSEVEQEYASEFGKKAAGPLEYALNIVLIAAGLGMLMLGSAWLVDSSSTIARAVGVSELVIGLTIVSIGTSLPEVATSFIAAMRGERDIAVGNVVGSNIFNLLFVMGFAGIIAPSGLPVAENAVRFDIPVMLATSLLCLPIMFVGHSITRWNGALFLAGYVAYTAYLILDATQSPSLPMFKTLMIQFALPLVIAAVLVVFLRSSQAQMIRQGANIFGNGDQPQSGNAGVHR